jgi:mRNA interferase MazF
VTRGDIYRVAEPASSDATRFRIFVVVSRQALIDSQHAAVVCAPVYPARIGLSTEVHVGPEEGLKHPGSIHCDVLLSVPKSALTHCVGRLTGARLAELDRALTAALGITSVPEAR